jgi:hypothetical protein
MLRVYRCCLAVMRSLLIYILDHAVVRLYLVHCDLTDVCTQFEPSPGYCTIFPKGTHLGRHYGPNIYLIISSSCVCSCSIMRPLHPSRAPVCQTLFSRCPSNSPISGLPHPACKLRHRQTNKHPLRPRSSRRLECISRTSSKAYRKQKTYRVETGCC